MPVVASVHDRAAHPAAAVALPVADRPRSTAGAGAVPDAGPHRPGRAASQRAAAGLTAAPVSRSRFADRAEAGRALGTALAERLDAEVCRRATVLGLPRGGVLVAAEVAAALRAPLDVLVVRKLGLPIQPELARGAIAAVGDAVETVRVESVIASTGVQEADFTTVREHELLELRRREDAYRTGRPALDVAGRTVLLVDDGLATGATMRAAVLAARAAGAAAVTVAVPVGSPRACAALATLADDLACLAAPADFRSVGQAYADFAQTTDDEVRRALTGARGAV